MTSHRLRSGSRNASVELQVKTNFVVAEHVSISSKRAFCDTDVRRLPSEKISIPRQSSPKNRRKLPRAWSHESTSPRMKSALPVSPAGIHTRWSFDHG